MKKFFFSVAALAAAMTFTACSDSMDIAEVGTPEWNEDGSGYIAFNVSLPAEKATRASSNDQFDFGKNEEYAVQDMYLVLFAGDTDNESTAKFAGAYKVTDLAGWTGSEVGDNATSNNITNHKTIAQKISKMGGNFAYAFIVLNCNNIFKVDGTELLVNGGNFNGTIQDLQKAMIVNIDNNATQLHNAGFLMMNAPLCTTPGGKNAATGDIKLLAKINRNNIKGTEAEARQEVAATVYVERAMAKVTMHASDGTSNFGEGDAENMDWKVTRWALDNTNKRSYLVRNTLPMEGLTSWAEWKNYASKAPGLADIDKYRFVGMSQCETSGLYRTYFGVDPNYDRYEVTDFNYVGAGSDATSVNPTNVNWHTNYWPGEGVKLGNDYPLYCAENIFNVRQQIWGATTRAIVEVTMNNGHDFFTTKEGSNVMYTDMSGITADVEARYLGALPVRNFAQDTKFVKSFCLEPAHVTFAYDAEKKEFVPSWKVVDYSTLSEADKLKSADDLKVNFVFYDANTIIANSNRTFVQGLQDGSFHWDGTADYTAGGWAHLMAGVDGSTPLYENEAAALAAGWTKTATPKTVADIPSVEDAGVDTKFYVYKDGKCYYETRIKHFGDDATPWNDWENKEGSTSQVPSVSVGAYPGTIEEAENNYLGRWGVLRNNWYDLNVSVIRNIGYVNPPTLKGNENNTDDELDQWIAVDVNILSWAKRTQDVEF